MPAKKRKVAKKSVAATKKAAGGKPIAKPEDLAQAFRQEFRPPEPPRNDVVVLDADVAPHFQSSRAVNEALRALLRIVRQIRSA